jgi:DNA-directed RNA polymerase I, II, and III subunit RPABC5
MLIPIRCFTCGNVIGDKWNPFVKILMEKKNDSKENIESELDIEYINITEDGSIKKSVEGEVMDELGLHKYCCRRMFLGNVHLISYI